MTIESEEFQLSVDTEGDGPVTFATLTDEDGNTINFLNPDVSQQTLTDADPDGESEVLPSLG